MTEQATAINGGRNVSNNPWHHMKGIQQHLRIEGKILPKHRLLRPFYHEYPKRLDDKQYVVPSLSSLKGGLHFFYGSLYLIAGGTAFLGWGAEGDLPQLFYASGIALLIAIPSHIYGRSLKYDLPLGYWSFLIQYMDKRKPLPDVPWLEAHPNKEPGLGEWSTWKKKMGTFQIDDPYALWLKELEQHPELDVGNFGGDTAKHNQLSFVIVATAFLVTAITITSITALIVVLTDSR